MGGAVVGGFTPTVLVEGKPVALGPVNAYGPHLCCGAPGCTIHCGGPIPAALGAAARVFVAGVPPILQGDTGACGEAVIGASVTVRVGA